jgi:hypothetical protein
MTRRPVLAFACDTIVVMAFVAIGRHAHRAGGGSDAFLRVLWPFLAGLATGWAVTGLAGAPLRWSRAVPAWALTVVTGMALRIVVEGRAFVVTFVAVATVFTGVCLLGWRAVARAGIARARLRVEGG